MTCHAMLFLHYIFTLVIKDGKRCTVRVHSTYNNQSEEEKEKKIYVIFEYELM